MDSEWVTCPYERAHRVPRARLQAHLVKCGACHPPLAVCPYSAAHRVPPQRLHEHVRECAAREALCAHAAPAAPEHARPRAALRAPDHEMWDD